MPSACEAAVTFQSFGLPLIQYLLICFYHIQVFCDILWQKIFPNIFFLCFQEFWTNELNALHSFYYDFSWNFQGLTIPQTTGLHFCYCYRCCCFEYCTKRKRNSAGYCPPLQTIDERWCICLSSITDAKHLLKLCWIFQTFISWSLNMDEMQFRCLIRCETKLKQQNLFNYCFISMEKLCSSAVYKWLCELNMDNNLMHL